MLLFTTVPNEPKKGKAGADTSSFMQQEEHMRQRVQAAAEAGGMPLDDGQTPTTSGDASGQNTASRPGMRVHIGDAELLGRIEGLERKIAALDSKLERLLAESNPVRGDIYREWVNGKIAIDQCKPVFKGYWLGEVFYQTKHDASDAHQLVCGERLAANQIVEGYAFVPLSDEFDPSGIQLNEATKAVNGAERADEKSWEDFQLKLRLAGRDSAGYKPPKKGQSQNNGSN